MGDQKLGRGVRWEMGATEDRKSEIAGTNIEHPTSNIERRTAARGAQGAGRDKRTVLSPGS